MEQLRRILLVGYEGLGLRARGLRVETVSLTELSAEIAASPLGTVTVLGGSVLVATSVRALSKALCRPQCIPFVCPDGALAGVAARWARESEFEFVDGAQLGARVAAAARVPMREAVPVAKWAPASARRSNELAPALEVLAGLHPLTVTHWATSLRKSRFQLYRLCERSSGCSAKRLTWLCLKATVTRMEATGHDPTRVFQLVGYSSDRALRRALARAWR